MRKLISTIALFLLNLTCWAQEDRPTIHDLRIGEEKLSAVDDYSKALKVKPILEKSDSYTGVVRVIFRDVPFGLTSRNQLDLLYSDSVLVFASETYFLRYAKNKLNQSSISDQLIAFANTYDLVFLSDKSTGNVVQGMSELDYDTIRKYVGIGVQKINSENSLTGKETLCSLGNLYSSTAIGKADEFYTGISIVLDRTDSIKGPMFSSKLFFVHSKKDTEDYWSKLLEGKWHLDRTLNEIKMIAIGGIYKVPVRLNNVIDLDFILDLGASDVSIPPDVFLVLNRTGTIHEEDFIGEETYSLADGTTIKSQTFILKELRLGNIILKNVKASISSELNSPLLLGQSAMKQLASYRIDNNKKLLIIE